MKNKISVKVLYFSVFSMFITSERVCAQSETFSGKISPLDKKTRIKELFLTKRPLNIVKIEFKFVVRTNTDTCNPLIFLHHDHQQGYGSTRGCFTLGDNRFLRPFDVRLLHKDYNREGCSSDSVAGVWTCQGVLDIANGYPVRRTVSMGYRCREDCTDRYLDFSYEVRVTEISHVPCETFDYDAIPGDFENFKEVVATCQTLYPTYSPINLFGMNINLINLIFTTAPNFFNAQCYQHTPEITCRSMFPECLNGSLVYPCREMCDDFSEACQSLVEQEDFPIECNNMQYSINDSSCIHQHVQCPEPNTSLPHGHVTLPLASRQLGYGMVVSYQCQTPYALSGSEERTCERSGKWTPGQPSCLFPEYIIITVSVLGVAILVVFLACIFYYFRLEIRVLMVNRCKSRKAKSSVKCGDIKAFHAFLCFAEQDFKGIVRPMLCELEQKHGYRLCVHQRNFLPGEYIEENIITAIGESYRVVIILSKAYLQSQWCIFEFEQAYLRSVSNPLFRLVVIVTENPKNLSKLDMPALVKAHLRTHTYISISDILFLEKLKAVLPRYPVRKAAKEGVILVRGGREDIVQHHGDVVDNV